MRRAPLLLFTLISLSGFTQMHCIRLNSTFILTNNPVGGFGYEYAADSSYFSWSINAEIGRYASSSFSSTNSSIDYYSLFGGGIVPEFRRYIGSGKFAPMGFFVGAYTRGRYLEKTVQHGVSTAPGGYQLDSPYTEETKGYAWDYGLAIGYKTGKQAAGIHVEALIGYGISHSELYDDPGHRQQLMRFELSISGIISRSKESTVQADW